MGEQVCTQMFVPLLQQMANDYVPNVRFNVCKTLERIAPLISKEVMGRTVLPLLTTLANDTDTDVQFFAKRCLDSLK